MIDEKRIAETVQKLRDDSCFGCFISNDECVSLNEVAADLIESLQLKLECRMEEVDQLQADLHLAYLNMESLQSLLTATIAGQETLQRALAASQAREEAAVEDINIMLCRSTDCTFCAYENGPCSYYDCIRNSEWRGVQEEHNG